MISNSAGQVDEGVKLVAETGRSLERIMAQVTEINAVVGEIAAGAHEQSTALQEINSAIEQMNLVTQQNAAMVEQSTAAGHSLSEEIVAAGATGRSIPARAAGERGDVAPRIEGGRAARLPATRQRAARCGPFEGGAPGARRTPGPDADQGGERRVGRRLDGILRRPGQVIRERDRGEPRRRFLRARAGGCGWIAAMRRG